MNIENLIVQLGADFRPLVQGLAGATREVQGTSRKISGILDGMSMAFRAFAVGAGAAIVSGVAGASFQAAAALKDLSEAIDVTTTSLQQLNYGALESGGSTEQMTRAWQRFSTVIGDVANGGDDIFSDIGINITNAAGAVRSFDDLLADVADRMEMAGTAQEKLSIATDFFGKDAAPVMVRMLRDGASGLEEFRDEADKLGVVLDEQLIEKADEIDKKFARLQYRLSTMAKREFVEFADAMTDMMTDLDYAWRKHGILSPLYSAAAAGQLASGRGISETPENINFTEEQRRRFHESVAAAEIPRGISYGPTAISMLRPGSKPEQIVDFDSGAGRRAAQLGERRLSQLEEAGKRMTRSYMTAEEEYAEDLKEWDELLAAKAISQETYNRAIEQSTASMKKARTVVDGLSQSTSRLGELAQSTFSTLSNDIMSATSAADVLRSTLSHVITQLAEMAQQSALSKGGIGGLFDGLVGSIFGSKKVPGAGKIPSYDVGTPYVPEDQLAMVHEGEMIVPADQARAMRTRSGRGGTIVINQITNVSTGVAQTVRAEMSRYSRAQSRNTAAAVMDAQRRGKLA